MALNPLIQLSGFDPDGSYAFCNGPFWRASAGQYHSMNEHSNLMMTHLNGRWTLWLWTSEGYAQFGLYSVECASDASPDTVEWPAVSLPRRALVGEFFVPSAASYWYVWDAVRNVYVKDSIGGEEYQLHEGYGGDAFSIYRAATGDPPAVKLAASSGTPIVMDRYIMGWQAESGVTLGYTFGLYLFEAPETVSPAVSDLTVAISTIEELQAIGNNSYTLAADYRQIKHLDGAGWPHLFRPFSSGHFAGFTGTYDGNGLTIANLTCQRWGPYTGIFGRTDTNSIVRNLGLLQIDCPDVDDDAGRLTSIHYGTVLRCYAVGGTMASSPYGGGLVGYNMNGTVQECYCNDSVHGVVGDGASAGIINCYHNRLGDTRGTYLADMKDAANYAGWDFETVWNIDPDGVVNQGYPYLGGHAVASTYPGLRRSVYCTLKTSLFRRR